MTRVVTVDPREPDPTVLAEAAATLRAGGLVAFPTETFYGLGAAALSERAVARVFDVKGRLAGKPILVLVDSIGMVESVVSTVPAAARALMARHWPGALTLILPARAGLPRPLTGDTGTIGVRLSPHPVARALVRALGEPITAPSANPAGLPPPTSAAGVLAHFDRIIELVLDGGETGGGEASTVVDTTTDPPCVLRQGPVRV